MDTNTYSQISMGNIANSSLLLDSHVCDSQNVSIFLTYLTMELFNKTFITISDFFSTQCFVENTSVSNEECSKVFNRKWYNPLCLLQCLTSNKFIV